MIDIVTGEVASLDKTSMVVMVGAVGLRVTVPMTVFEAVHGVGDNVRLFRHLTVREADTDVIAALTAMGFSIVETQSAVQSIPRNAPKTIEERIRLALQYFS